MIIQKLLLASESYTNPNWEYRNVHVEFSRLYYIIDGEAYYEEKGKRVRLKKNHLYLTPVRQSFDLYENPNDKLLHTYVHIVTLPAVTKFTEIEVVKGTPLADGVALWRKHILSGNNKLIWDTVQFVVSCIENFIDKDLSVASKTRSYIDNLTDFDFSMRKLSFELGYCREYITRQFQLEYRMTPVQYFNQRKMNIALEKMIGGASVKKIADELNYSSPFAFSKSFKKFFGLSPKKYLSTLDL